MGADPWRPNFRLNYWCCLLLAIVGVAAAVYGLVNGTFDWFMGGAAIAIIALLIPRLRGRGSVPIPGMNNPLEGDFAPIGEPQPAGEKVTVLEPDDPERRAEPAPPQE
jgi:hypothetical protein